LHWEWPGSICWRGESWLGKYRFNRSSCERSDYSVDVCSFRKNCCFEGAKPRTWSKQYLAHLHFELRDATTIDVLRGYLAEKGVHLAPNTVISQYEGKGGLIGPASAIKVLENAKAKTSAELPIDVLQRLR